MAKTIHLIAAARPNFMKVAPLYHALDKVRDWADPVIVHTGQHYDPNMSDAFFADLRLPAPHVNLEIGSGSHAEQTGGVMIAYEKLCLARAPDWVVVVGDVNSTLACALVAKKLCLPLAHLEAGLRSRDRTMPEEINRIVTDAIADLLWTPSPDADENLRGEGVQAERIERVGNIMIDSYELVRDRIEADPTPDRLGLRAGEFGVVTLHRPANVDDPAILSRIVGELSLVSHSLRLVFAVHPRTRKRLEEFGLLPRITECPGITIIEPLGYINFMALVRKARLVITDSGGVQEETTYLDIPCLTLRDTTERPITLTQGTNRLIAPNALATSVASALAGDWPHGRRPALWDGRTAERVAASLRRHTAREVGVARN
ncbi:MAG TPA: UDP-N-acetylglucosamine 2-epimerase (non-hydrolyzing) [Stellaceae bacterium]|nr:UDP-N-acetylglucosamine 2-epimerase (non-hydrolyzing) [Stellaceae bacterium]